MEPRINLETLKYLKILHSRKDFYQALILVRVSSVTKGMAKIIQGVNIKYCFKLALQERGISARWL